MRKKEFIFWICCAGVLIAVNLIARYISLTKKIMQASDILGWAFCIISIICFWGIFIHPIVRALCRPHIGKRPIDEDTKARLRQHVREAAKTSLLLTTISQNGVFDFVANIYLCIKMIGSLVREAGYRPGIFQLFRLYKSVVKTSLLVVSTDEILENIDIPSLVGNAGASAVCKVFKPVANGIANSYMCMRLGYSTIKYLDCGHKEYLRNKSAIRKEVKKEARTDFKEIVMPFVKKEN